MHLQKVNCIKLLAGDTFLKYTVRKRGHHVAAEACHQDPVTTGRDHQHAGAKGRVTRLRTPGHTVGSVGQPGE